MSSVRVAGLLVVPVFLTLTTTEASACSCGNDTQEQKFEQADLVVRGRMKMVAYGVTVPELQPDGEEPYRVGRGDIEIESVIKGSLTEKTVSVYTGSGLGDCGLMGTFFNLAVYYNHEKFGVFELGLRKADTDSKATIYTSSICEYAKDAKNEEQ